MKTLKHLSKLGKILLGLFGVAALFSSCAKEKDCDCTYSIYGYDMEFTVTTKTKCEDLKFSYSGYDMDMECK